MKSPATTRLRPIRKARKLVWRTKRIKPPIADGHSMEANTLTETGQAERAGCWLTAPLLDRFGLLIGRPSLFCDRPSAQPDAPEQMRIAEQATRRRTHSFSTPAWSGLVRSQPE